MRIPQLDEFGRKKLVVSSLAAGAVVVALAGVIFISSALSSPKGSSTVPPVQQSATDAAPAQQTADEAYQKALDAYRSGDATAAAAILNRQLAANPSDERARALLEEVTGGSSSGSSSGSTPGSGTTSTDTSSNGVVVDTKYDKPVAAIAALLPSKIANFEVGQPVIVDGDASVSVDPIDRPTQDRVSHAILAVHQLASKADAAAYIKKVTKKVCPQDGQAVRIGTSQGYFGTDGRNKAMVTYVRGVYVFETIVTTTSQHPGSLKDISMSLAQAYRD